MFTFTMIQIVAAPVQTDDGFLMIASQVSHAPVISTVPTALAVIKDDKVQMHARHPVAQLLGVFLALKTVGEM